MAVGVHGAAVTVASTAPLMTGALPPVAPPLQAARTVTALARSAAATVHLPAVVRLAVLGRAFGMCWFPLQIRVLSAWVRTAALKVEPGEGAALPCKHGALRRVNQIRAEIDKSDSDYDREKLQERMTKLAGCGLALIQAVKSAAGKIAGLFLTTVVVVADKAEKASAPMGGGDGGMGGLDFSSTPANAKKGGSPIRGAALFCVPSPRAP